MGTVTDTEVGIISTEHNGPDAAGTLITVPEGVNPRHWD